jgi:DNA-binding NarL/FixJ family response regulator
MPRLDGIEATRAIHNAFGQVRIIGLSLFDPAERAQAAKDAGAVGYLSKDAAAADLVAAIRACMHGAGEGRAAAPAAR